LCVVCVVCCVLCCVCVVCLHKKKVSLGSASWPLQIAQYAHSVSKVVLLAPCTASVELQSAETTDKDRYSEHAPPTTNVPSVAASSHPNTYVPTTSWLVVPEATAPVQAPHSQHYSAQSDPSASSATLNAIPLRPLSTTTGSGTSRLSPKWTQLFVPTISFLVAVTASDFEMAHKITGCTCSILER